MDPKLFHLSDPAGLVVAGVVLVLVFAVRILPLLLNRNRPLTRLPLGAPRQYGLMGGALCPRCHRPFPFGFLAFNFGLGTKVARCEFCGKWSLVRRLGAAELRAAEAAEVAEAQAGPTSAHTSEAEKQKKAADDSRFMQ